MMGEKELLNQTEHISEIFTKIVMKTMSTGLSDLPKGAGGEISMAQFQALKHIAQHGDCTIGGLAEGLDISQPAATMLADRMVRKGLLARRTEDSDRRQAHLALTSRAEGLLARAEEERAEKMARVLDRLTPSEREQLVHSLEKFVSAALELETPADQACLKCGIEHDSGCVVNRARLAATGAGSERT